MVRALRRSERRVSPRLSLKTIVIPVLFVNILYTVEVVPFLGMMLVEIALLTITVLAGLAIKFVASIYGRDFKKGLAPGLDNLISELLVRKRVSSTFFRLYLWNLSIALLLISVGFITFGTFPLVWAFLTLGLAAPSLGSFKGRPHLWFEASAFLTSASLGLWGGLRIGNVQAVSVVSLPLIGFILVLHGSAALLEALETRPEGE